MDVTAAVAESARVFGLTVKEKQLQSLRSLVVGIHLCYYQQAMESPYATLFFLVCLTR